MIPTIVSTRVLRSFVWGAERDPSKNREVSWSLVLAGHRLMMTHNNQPKVGVHIMVSVISSRGAWGRGGAWKGSIASIWLMN
jgi:hypothetical protein